MADNESARTTAQLLQFVAFELKGAFTHIGRAMAAYSETGSLPPSMFDVSAPANKRQKRKDRGLKRKPSAFNNFVKEKMAEIRASGNGDEDHVVANGTNIFSQAVDEWKKLSDEDKKAYAEKFKAEEGEDEAALDDEDIDQDEEDHDEGQEDEDDDEEEEEEPAVQEPPPQAPSPKVEAPQPPSGKKEKKRKNASAEEPKAKNEKAAPAAAEEPKSEKKKKKKKDK